jgi:hypothetical protein
MWIPAQVRLGQVRPRLGQTSEMINRSAQAIIEKAEPRLRALLSEERTKLSDSVNSGLPYAGLAAATFLASSYLVPKKDETARFVGYGISAALLGVGVWTAWKGITTPPPLPPAPTPEDPGIIGEVLSTLVDPTSRKLAAAIVAEAEPRVRKIMAESGQKLSDVTSSVIPWWALAAATCIGSMFLIPESMPAGKAAAYAASAGSFLFGIHQAAETLEAPVDPVQEGTVTP